jgi:MYXO-CTERM domain-containing protein
MRESLRVLAATATLAMVSFGGAALADVPPPDACQSISSVGQPCSNADPNANQPGVCVASTCERPTPDGSTSYPCALCQASDACSAKDGGGSSDGSGSGKSGCTMSPLERDGATGFGMLALGIGALALARRRRP